MSEQPALNPTIVVVTALWLMRAAGTGVTDRSQQQGYTVVVLANPPRGVAGDSAHLASVVNQIDGPVLLARHSSAGR